MIKAIEEYHVEGVKQHCLWEICFFEHEAFRSGKFDTCERITQCRNVKNK
jgi:propionyl-CoA carboxylase alpha chain